MEVLYVFSSKEGICRDRNKFRNFFILFVFFMTITSMYITTNLSDTTKVIVRRENNSDRNNLSVDVSADDNSILKVDLQNAGQQEDVALLYHVTPSSIEKNNVRPNKMKEYNNNYNETDDVLKSPPNRKIMQLQTTVAHEVVRSRISWDTSNQTVPIPSFQRLATYFKYENVSFKTYQLNAFLGQTLPLVRQLPNVTPESCKLVQYPSYRGKARVSVVIPFHNELWAVLLRNIYSVLEYSPAELLQEILLVDDNSTAENLQTPLENYIQWLPKIRLLRTKERAGLMRARMVGARNTKGNIIVFLDAHVEVCQGWLQPLVAAVLQDPTTVAIPNFPEINPHDFSYFLPGYPDYRLYGTFTWELDYFWTGERILDQRYAHKPYPTATMIGCGFAVSRSYFFEMGGYDEGMNIWGGENLEISFRTWQCGGSLRVVPCSSVGHIFRPHLPYFYSDDTLARNLQRLVEVWLDDYKQYVYQVMPNGMPPISTISKTDRETLKQRQMLRKLLKCKSFSWYLQHVANDTIVVPRPDSDVFGQMTNIASGLCVHDGNNKSLVFNTCVFVSKHQHFSITNKSRIISSLNGQCLGLADRVTGLVSLQICDDRSVMQSWTFVDYLVPEEIKSKVAGIESKKPIGKIVFAHGNYNLCLTAVANTQIQTVAVLYCNASDPSQYFTFTHRRYIRD